MENCQPLRDDIFRIFLKVSFFMDIKLAAFYWILIELLYSYEK